MRARVCACASLYIITTLSTKSIGKRCSKIVVAILKTLCHISIIENATGGPAMYRLTANLSNRSFPESVTSENVMRLAKRRNGESVGFDNGGDVALVLDADGNALAEYEYRGYVFSAEAYLNG
jgi:hypothetical protein